MANKKKIFVNKFFSCQRCSGPAVNWLAVISGLSTVNGVCDADPVFIGVPSVATDGLAGVIGVPALSGDPAAAGVHATAGIPDTAGVPTAVAGISDTADVPASDRVTDETGVPAIVGVLGVACFCSLASSSNKKLSVA
jgi:hypothetical protein